MAPLKRTRPAKIAPEQRAPLPRCSSMLLVASAPYLQMSAQPPANPSVYLSRSSSFNNLRQKSKQDLVNSIRGNKHDTCTNIRVEAPAQPPVSDPHLHRLASLTNNRYAENATNIVRLELLLYPTFNEQISPSSRPARLDSNPSSISNYNLQRSNSNTPQTSVSGSDAVSDAVIRSESSSESVNFQNGHKENPSLESIKEFKSAESPQKSINQPQAEGLGPPHQSHADIEPLLFASLANKPAKLPVGGSSPESFESAHDFGERGGQSENADDVLSLPEPQDEEETPADEDAGDTDSALGEDLSEDGSLSSLDSAQSSNHSSSPSQKSEADSIKEAMPGSFTNSAFDHSDASNGLRAPVARNSHQSIADLPEPTIVLESLQSNSYIRVNPPKRGIENSTPIMDINSETPDESLPPTPISKDTPEAKVIPTNETELQGQKLSYDSSTDKSTSSQTEPAKLLDEYHDTQSYTDTTQSGGSSHKAENDDSTRGSLSSVVNPLKRVVKSMLLPEGQRSEGSGLSASKIGRSLSLRSNGKRSTTASPKLAVEKRSNENGIDEKTNNTNFEIARRLSFQGNSNNTAASNEQSKLESGFAPNENASTNAVELSGPPTTINDSIAEAKHPLPSDPIAKSEVTEEQTSEANNIKDCQMEPQLDPSDQDTETSLKASEVFSSTQIDNFLSDSQAEVPPRGDVAVKGGAIKLHKRNTSSISSLGNTPKISQDPALESSREATPNLNHSSETISTPTKSAFAPPGGRFSMLAVVDVDYDKSLPPTPIRNSAFSPNFDFLDSDIDSKLTMDAEIAEERSSYTDVDSKSSDLNSTKGSVFSERRKLGLRRYLKAFGTRPKPSDGGEMPARKLQSKSLIRSFRKATVPEEKTGSSKLNHSSESVKKADPDSTLKSMPADTKKRKKRFLSNLKLTTGLKLDDIPSPVYSVREKVTTPDSAYATLEEPQGSKFDLPNYEADEDDFEDILLRFDEVEREAEKEMLTMRKSKNMHDFFAKDDELTKAQIDDQQKKDIHYSDESLPARLGSKNNSTVNVGSLESLSGQVQFEEFDSEFPDDGSERVISLTQHHIRTGLADPQKSYLKYVRQFSDFEEIEITLTGFDPTRKSEISDSPDEKISILRRGEKKERHNVSFSHHISVSETYAPYIYKRNNKSVTQYYVTEFLEINKIKNELNAYKCYEMLVHEKSQMNTHFYY